MRQILVDAQRETRLYRSSLARSWPLERNVWQCLCYPLQAFWGIVCLGLLGAISMLILATTIRLRTVRDDDLSQALLLVIYIFAILAPQMGIVWSFLRQVLRSAVIGKTDLVSRPTFYRNPRATVHDALMMPVTFLAGPIFILAAAVYFWVQAGKLELLDHLLLWQLWLATGVSWTFLLLAVEARGRLRDAHAKAAASLFYRQGWPALLFPLVAGTTLTVFVYLSVRTWILLFDEGFAAFALQFLLWCTALYCWTFLMRWYGITRYWRRQARHSRESHSI